LTYIDLYNNGVIPTGVFDIGIHKLDKGEHKLRVEIVGANEKAVKAYMFGIDYLLLTELKSGFYLPENPSYTILDSARDLVRFAVERTLIEYKGHICSKAGQQNATRANRAALGSIESEISCLCRS